MSDFLQKQTPKYRSLLQITSTEQFEEAIAFATLHQRGGAEVEKHHKGHGLGLGHNQLRIAEGLVGLGKTAT